MNCSVAIAADSERNWWKRPCSMPSPCTATLTRPNSAGRSHRRQTGNPAAAGAGTAGGVAARPPVRRLGAENEKRPRRGLLAVIRSDQRAGAGTGTTTIVSPVLPRWPVAPVSPVLPMAPGTISRVARATHGAARVLPVSPVLPTAPVEPVAPGGTCGAWRSRHRRLAQWRRLAPLRRQGRERPPGPERQLPGAGMQRKSSPPPPLMKPLRISENSSRKVTAGPDRNLHEGSSLGRGYRRHGG